MRDEPWVSLIQDAAADWLIIFGKASIFNDERLRCDIAVLQLFAYYRGLHMTFLRKAIHCCLFTAAASAGPVAFSQYNGAIDPPEHLAAGYHAMSEEQSREWLGILAGPVFEGRGTGQLGYVRAAHWVAGKVAEFGLEPKGEAGTYFQFLPVTRQTIDATQSEIAGPGDLKIPGSEFGLDRFINQAEIAGKLSFVKLIGNAPKLEENLRDKIVICVTDEQNAGRASFMLGRQRPAAFLRVVETTPTSAPQLRRPKSNPTGTSGTITKQAAAKIAEASGLARIGSTFPLMTQLASARRRRTSP